MILITGATGKAGGELARQLTDADIPFSAIVRNPDKAEALQDMDADVVIGDLADREFVERALAGITQAVLIMPNVENQLAVEQQFVDAAVAAGVENIVYLSSIESLPDATNPITRIHVETENHIRASGLHWTMIRPAFFMQTFLASAPRIRETGQIVLPLGNGTVSATDLRDVAAVMVKVLTEPGHTQQSYDITGPELLTLTEIAKRFSTLLGRQYTYIDLPLDAFRERLKSVGFSDWRINAVSAELASIAAGSLDHTTTTIATLLDRPATSIDEFIADHAELFR